MKSNWDIYIKKYVLFNYRFFLYVISFLSKFALIDKGKHRRHRKKVYESLI